MAGISQVSGLPSGYSRASHGFDVLHRWCSTNCVELGFPRPLSHGHLPGTTKPGLPANYKPFGHSELHTWFCSYGIHTIYLRR